MVLFLLHLIRAKYITGTVDALQSKPGGGAEWLASMRKLDLPVVIDALSTLPGVGPKVAACIALFSLDQHHAIPVDTHVWQVSDKVSNISRVHEHLIPRAESVVRVMETSANCFLHGINEYEKVIYT